MDLDQRTRASQSFINVDCGARPHALCVPQQHFRGKRVFHPSGLFPDCPESGWNHQTRRNACSFLAISPALIQERLCPSRETRRILPVSLGLRSSQQRGHHPDLRRRFAQALESPLFRLSPASRLTLPVHNKSIRVVAMDRVRASWRIFHRNHQTFFTRKVLQVY